jgi:hypothetical protein
MFLVLSLDLYDDALLAARLGRNPGRHQGEPSDRRGRDDQGQALHPLRGGVPRRMRQRAHGPNQRRLLRGPDGEGHARDSQRPEGGAEAAGGAAQRTLRRRTVWTAHLAD